MGIEAVRFDLHSPLTPELVGYSSNHHEQHFLSGKHRWIPPLE